MEAKEKTNRKVKLNTITPPPELQPFDNFSGSQQSSEADFRTFSLLQSLLTESPSIATSTVNWLIEQTIKKSQSMQIVKNKIEGLFDHYTSILQSTVEVEYEKYSDKLNKLADKEPLSCGAVHVVDCKQRSIKLEYFERKHEEQRNSKLDKTLFAKPLADKNYQTNPTGFKKEHIGASRTPCISLADSPPEPQSPLINQLRQTSFCPIFDNFKQRKQNLSKKQKQNIQNLRNVAYTFDYSSEKINVSRALRTKISLMNVSAIMDIDSGSKTKVQTESSSTFEKSEIKGKKSVFVDNLIQGNVGYAESSQTTVLKGLLDKIMNNNNKGLKMPSVNKKKK